MLRARWRERMPREACVVHVNDLAPETPHSTLVMRLALLQQLLHGLNLVLEPLLLIRPTSDPDITLDPHNAILVQHGMALPDDSHHVVPRALLKLLALLSRAHYIPRPRPSLSRPRMCCLGREGLPQHLGSRAILWRHVPTVVPAECIE